MKEILINIGILCSAFGLFMIIMAGTMGLLSFIFSLINIKASGDVLLLISGLGWLCFLAYRNE